MGGIIVSNDTLGFSEASGGHAISSGLPARRAHIQLWRYYSKASAEVNSQDANEQRSAKSSQQSAISNQRSADSGQRSPDGRGRAALCCCRGIWSPDQVGGGNWGSSSDHSHASGNPDDCPRPDAGPPIGSGVGTGDRLRTIPTQVGIQMIVPGQTLDPRSGRGWGRS
jgi:hypothetical protein